MMAASTSSAAQVRGRVTEAPEAPPAPARTLRRMEPRDSFTDQPRGQEERRRATQRGVETEVGRVIGQEQTSLIGLRLSCRFHSHGNRTRAVLRPRTRALQVDGAPLLQRPTAAVGEPRRQFHAPPGARLNSSRGSTSARPILGSQSPEAIPGVCPLPVHRGQGLGRGHPLDKSFLPVCTRRYQVSRSSVALMACPPQSGRAPST